MTRRRYHGSRKDRWSAPCGSQVRERALLAVSSSHLIGEINGGTAGQNAGYTEQCEQGSAGIFLLHLWAKARAQTAIVRKAAIATGWCGHRGGLGGIGFFFAIAEENAVHVAELKRSARGEIDGFDAGSADFGAVGGTEVGERPTAAVEGELTMVTGHRIVSDDELVVISTPHGHAFGVEFEGARGTVRSGELNTWHNSAVLAGRGRGGKRDSRQVAASLRGRAFLLGRLATIPATLVTQIFEILGKFDTESDCHKLLYAPHPLPLKYREGRVYKIEFEGDEAALKAFVDKVLIDSISQEARIGGQPAFEKAAFVLEYGMKGAALDLEKEMILNYYRGTQNPGFEIKKLTLRTRIYVFGEGAEPAQFVRDIVNPAIHTHEVLKAA